MKKINIKPEKPAVSDEQIASTKVPFAEILTRHKALPKAKPGLNQGRWWIISGITLTCIIALVLLNNRSHPSSDSQSNSNAETIIIADSLNRDTTKNSQCQRGKNPIIVEKWKQETPFADQDTTHPDFPLRPATVGTKNTIPHELKNDTNLTAMSEKINSHRKCNSKMPDCSGFVQSQRYNSGSYGTLLVLIEEDGLFGLKSTNGRIVLAPKYDKIFPFGIYHPSWALVEKDGLYGFVNMFGSEVFRPKYNRVCNFGDYQPSWALVEKDGQYGFITTNGSEIVPPEYDAIYKFGDYSPALALVEKDGLFGFLAINGSEMVKPKYDLIGKYGEYNPGLALVEKDGLQGLINRFGTEIIQPKYNHIYPFGENLSGFAIVEKNGLQGLISVVGVEMIKPKYDRIHKFGELRTHCAVVEKNGLFGFVVINGEEMIKPEYETIEELKKHIINPKKNNKTGKEANTNHIDNSISSSDPKNSGEVKIIKNNGDTLNAIILNYNSCKNIITYNLKSATKKYTLFF